MSRLPKTLAPGFQFESFDSLYARLNIPLKTEFETNAEHDAKLAAVADTLWHGFVIDSMCAATEITYNADDQKFKATLGDFAVGDVLVGAKLSLSGSDRRQVCVRVVGAAIRTFEASNGYGAKATVRSITDTIDAVRMPVVSTLGSERFSIPKGEAANVKPQICFVLFARIGKDKESGYTQMRYRGHTATVTSPSELHTYSRLLLASTVEVAVTNRETGQVYAWLTRGPR